MTIKPLNQISYPGAILMAAGLTAAMAVGYCSRSAPESPSSSSSKDLKTSSADSPLTPSQIAIVKSTAPLLKEHGEQITTLFYSTMIRENPDLNNTFNRTSQATGAQPRALASAVFAFASYVDQPEMLSGAVARMASKHASLGIRPEQYEIVGKYLIQAVAEVLGDAVTAEVAEAWTAAYGMLAGILINAEKDLYKSFEGWDDWRTFRIEKKETQSSSITSFYLVPKDGRPLPSYKPGQYISLRIFIPELGCMQPRQYSLSEDPLACGGKYYRIGVKKDAGEEVGIPGLISNRLHDTFNVGDEVELTHPSGLFFLDPNSPGSSPVVLISAGVGVTPMISILNSITNSSSRRPISWIHGTKTASTHAFKAHVQDLVKGHPNMTSTVFRSQGVDEDEVEGVDYDFLGRIDVSRLDGEKTLFLGDKSTRYYVCGAKSFMLATRDVLKNAGVDEARIHMEVFGTGGL